MSTKAWNNGIGSSVHGCVFENDPSVVVNKRSQRRLDIVGAIPDAS